MEVEPIISIECVIEVTAGIASASFTLVFSLTTGIIKKILQITSNKKEKRNKIVMLAKSKLNSIETLTSQALIDLENSHEKFKTIVNQKVKYKRMKENISMMKSSDKLSENNKSIRENRGIHRIKKYYFFLSKYKCLKLVLKNTLMSKFAE